MQCFLTPDDPRRRSGADPGQRLGAACSLPSVVVDRLAHTGTVGRGGSRVVMEELGSSWGNPRCT